MASLGWSLACLMMMAVAASAQLSPSFYSSSCPNALSTIKSTVDAAVAKEARMGASMLRLHFHDCFVNGCDASILLDSIGNFTGEKGSDLNLNSARGYGVIDTIKANVEKVCPGVVSCADILAVVARDTVVALGGPTWTVQLGRRDSTIPPSPSAASSDIHATAPGASTFNMSIYTAGFAARGFSVQEMVALTGGHTIGQARCASYRARIYNESYIDPAFATALKRSCPSSGEGNHTAPIDIVTATKFDNNYYKNLLVKKGLLPSDQLFYSGGSGPTDPWVVKYSASQSAFFADFTAAVLKMGRINVLTGSSGQVRTNCRRPN